MLPAPLLEVSNRPGWLVSPTGTGGNPRQGCHGPQSSEHPQHGNGNLLLTSIVLTPPTSDHDGQVTPESTTITSLTLARLSGSPERVASYLAFTQEQRLQWLAAAVKRLALLLPKYDNLPQYRDEADSIVDDIMERGVT